MSLSASSCFSKHPQYFHQQPQNDHIYTYDSYLPPTPQSAPTSAPFQELDGSTLFEQALAQLQNQSGDLCMQNQQYSDPSATAHSQYPTSTSAPPSVISRQDSARSSNYNGQYNAWQHMHGLNMGGPATHTQQGLKRVRSHQRTPSASTFASAGPDSPYTYNNFNPQIANTDYVPRSPAHYVDHIGQFSKHPPTPVQTPTDYGLMGPVYLPNQTSHMPAPHQAMKHFAIDYHNLDEPDYSHSAQHSMSSHSNEGPSTPHSGIGENVQSAQYSGPHGETHGLDDQTGPDCLLFDHADFKQYPDLQLARTESQAFQDELYNPPTTTYSAAPSSASQHTAAHDFLTPHRNIMTERLQTANNIRSQSPVSAMSRERSPFRDGSPLAPTANWPAPNNGMGTASSMRQQQNEHAERAELAQHIPLLRRKPTETISPKDALLDYNEPDQPSLFQDSIPAGYRQHTTGTRGWPTTDFENQPGSAFGNLQTPSQQPFTSFRATSADAYSGPDPNTFGGLLPPATIHDQHQVQNAAYHGISYVAPPTKMISHDSNPEFPAHLTSMESSMSDNGPPLSSQGSAINIPAPQRPADTRAATGTYTCTYHGCTHRFDSHANLQKHKRDARRSQPVQRGETPLPATSAASSHTADGSVSPRSSGSPGADGDDGDEGMTSAALLARNNQAGPHKCTRTNPSTGKACNTIFSRPYDLTRHEDTIHNGRKMKVRCPMCREEKTFSRNDALTRHMRVVHPEVEQYGKRGRRGE